MDRDQDQFFEEPNQKNTGPEQQEQQPAAEQGQPRVDDQTYLLKLLDYLEEALEYGSVVPLTNKRLVDSDKCLDIVDDMRRNLPDAIQYASQIMNDRERILKNAERSAANRIKAAEVRADATIQNAEQLAKDTVAEAESRADKIIADAENRAMAMTNQNAIKIAAQNEARDIINQAKADANQCRLDAASYGEGLLVNVERELQKAVDMVRYRREHLDSSDQKPRQ
jgi:vacuolar-type H+-ATPase subunit H